MRLIAIDQGSRKCGFAIFDENGNLEDSGVITSRKKDRAQRYKEIIDDLMNLICDSNVKAMAIEDVFLKRSGFSNPKTTKIMGETRGVIMSIGLIYDLEITNVNPSDLTKYLHINTKTQDKKQVTMMYAEKVAGHKVKEDEADAIVIGMITRSRWI